MSVVAAAPDEGCAQCAYRQRPRLTCAISAARPRATRRAVEWMQDSVDRDGNRLPGSHPCPFFARISVTS